MPAGLETLPTCKTGTQHSLSRKVLGHEAQRRHELASEPLLRDTQSWVLRVVSFNAFKDGPRAHYRSKPRVGEALNSVQCPAAEKWLSPAQGQAKAQAWRQTGNSGKGRGGSQHTPPETPPPSERGPKAVGSHPVCSGKRHASSWRLAWLCPPSQGLKGTSYSPLRPMGNQVSLQEN